jgi:hypothetical protein
VSEEGRERGRKGHIVGGGREGEGGKESENEKGGREGEGEGGGGRKRESER